MTPIDVMFWITVMLFFIAIAFLALGLACDAIEEGFGVALVFFGAAFTTFVIYAFLWVILQAVT